MSTIPVSTIVAVNPAIISAGGTALTLSGLFLSTSARLPYGSVLSFPTALSVINYFGSGSTEATAAPFYFNSFDNSNIKPAAMLFSAYPASAISAFLRGGSLASMTLSALQALSGTLIVTVDGVQKTSSTITLSGAASFSAAATLIQSAFTTPGFVVTFDSVASAFLFTDSSTGATSTLTFATGTLSTSLMLTQATGAVLSQGAAATTPSAAMAAIINQTTNWASFTTLFNPDVSGNANKLLFAAWTNTQNNRFAYACWDNDTTPTTSNNATTSIGNILLVSNSTGTICIYTATNAVACMVCGMIASIDFTETNGVVALEFKSQSGMPADVTDPTTAANLQANGYNYYGSYATAAQGFSFYYPGSISGPFKWADAYVNEVWLNEAFRLALITLLTSVKSLPYDALGYSLIRAAMQDPINQGLNAGVFAPGVALSMLQIAEVNAAAGMPIDKFLSANGYYLQILPATAQVRGSRTSPPITFFYTSPGSVNKLSIASIEIQ